MRTRLDHTKAILDFIERKGLSDQAPLPPERELAVALGLSRGQLRAGLTKLKALGKVWGQVGKGTFVGSKPAVSSESVLLLTALTNPKEIMEARLALEPMLAALAALRGTSSELAHLQSCLARSRAARDIASFELWDEAIHKTISEAAKNKLLRILFDAVMASRRSIAWGRIRDRSLESPRRKLYLAQHSDIVRAICDRDSPLAEAKMRLHLETVGRNCDLVLLRQASRVEPEAREAGVALQKAAA